MDYINSLPTDDEPLNPDEKQISDIIFRDDASIVHKFISDLKLPLISGIIFLIINSAFVSDFLQSNIAYVRKSNMSLLCLKTILFMICIFVLMNH